jgi:uncharacterized protein (DUF1800 family)
MPLDRKAKAALALHRFGLGPRAGSIKAIASDPLGALLAELDRPNAGRIDNPDLPTSAAAMRATFDAQQALQFRPAKQPNAPMMGSSLRSPLRYYLDEAEARYQAALGAEIGFVERLVWFWSNHFCVSADKGNVVQVCGAYERKAIRANVLGRFGDMLQAAVSHPAMLLYLDNALSIGPDSNFGFRYKRGLNENLARELMELHTLGVRGGYTQADVTQLAHVMTGWTIVFPRQDTARAGEFSFNPDMHQGGPQTVLGKRYPEAGVEQGRAVLADLARHPATARHLANKLVRHFVADVPPSALVERLARRFLDTQGDLKEVTKALVTAPEAWQAPATKLKRPGEWIVGALRAIDIGPSSRADAKSRSLGLLPRAVADIQPIMQAQGLLGEPLWRPPAPRGFADDSAPWLDGLAQRVDIADQLARRAAGQLDPRDVFEQVLAPLASTETRHAIIGAASRPQALALLFMAPEFQRR